MSQKSNFIVIDTEGKNVLNEIAIIDSQGKLRYEAFAEEYDGHYEIKLNRKPLQQIIIDFIKIAQNKLIVCHSAEHDRRVLKNSFTKVGINWQHFKFDCTYKLARQYLNNLSSYSLEYLSKKLNLKVNNKYFNSQQAHTARYDTEFTYQLYRFIMQQQELKTATNKPNPFGSSRVDTPFQNHPDLTSIHQNQFTILKTILAEIKSDLNHQTKGAVVIGEPGTGKTHLIMRLANELLEHNRLLFIRQPNNPDTVIYHTYSRILESLVEQVPQSNYSQLEHLLANSFVKLIRSYFIVAPTQKDRYILEETQNNTLKLYYSLGAEGTQRKREYWQHIEKRTVEWWLNNYGAAGSSLEIIKGIVKFCSYSDAGYKRLVTRWLAADSLEESELEKIGLSDWNESMSKEAFSLEAIGVLSKLSLLDEPLIVVFDQLEGLGLPHNERLLLNFGEAIKEIFTHVPNSLIILNLFPDRWQQFQTIFDGSIIDRISQHQVILEKPHPTQLKQILQTKARSVGVNIEALFTTEELNDIIDRNSIRAVLNRAYDYYRAKVNKISLPSSATTEVADTKEQTVIDRLQSLEERVSQLQQVWQNVAQALTILPEVRPEVKQTSNFTPDIVTEANTKSQSPEKQKFIKYLETQKQQLQKQYSLPQIIDDSDDIGKLRTITEAFNTNNDLAIDHLRLGKKKLPEHFLIKKNSVSCCLGFLQIGGSSFTNRIKNYNTLVVNHKEIEFVLWRDSRQPDITGKVGKEEIMKLNNAPNGNYLKMGKENRIHFELLYKSIVDIQNRDLDISLKTALEIFSSELKNYWLIETLSNRGGARG